MLPRCLLAHVQAGLVDYGVLLVLHYIAAQLPEAFRSGAYGGSKRGVETAYVSPALQRFLDQFGTRPAFIGGLLPTSNRSMGCQ